MFIRVCYSTLKAELHTRQEYCNLMNLLNECRICKALFMHVIFAMYCISTDLLALKYLYIINISNKYEPSDNIKHNRHCKIQTKSCWFNFHVTFVSMFQDLNKNIHTVSHAFCSILISSSFSNLEIYFLLTVMTIHAVFMNSYTDIYTIKGPILLYYNI